MPLAQRTGYSPDCLERLSEKGYEQRSEREFGWYTEAKYAHDSDEQGEAPVDGEQAADRLCTWRNEKNN